MPNIEKMREMIARQYDADKWRERCKQMRPNQVCAIYYKWKESGIFDRPKKKKPKSPYVQISIWDLGIDLYGQGSNELRNNDDH